MTFGDLSIDCLFSLSQGSKGDGFFINVRWPVFTLLSTPLSLLWCNNINSDLPFLNIIRETAIEHPLNTVILSFYILVNEL